jgi:hypothetical protein
MNTAFITNYEHKNGTTSGTPGTVSTLRFSRRSFNILIDNLSSTSILYISLDDGTAYKTIDAGGSLAAEWVGHDTIKLKSAGASQNYEILVGSIA